MKNRDILLFGLPISAALLVAAFAAFLYTQTADFENAYLEETEYDLAQKTKIIAAAIRPMLENGKNDEAYAFCASFTGNPLRLTLINESGKVAADSWENPSFMGSHLDREEVKAAFSGVPSGNTRYSESTGRTMLYYAVPVDTKNARYVLRSAVSEADKVTSMLDLARLNMFWALLFGAEIVLLFAFYMAKRVRKPLLELQKSVAEIASGRLDTHIAIPENGIVRELASGVSEMAEQLKRRLAQVTAERNERKLLFDTMSEGVMLFSPDGTLVRSNKAADILFGIPEKDARFNLARCKMPELLELAHRTFLSGEGFEKEFTFPSGTPDSPAERSFFMRGRLLGGDGGAEGGRHLLLTITELTDLKKLESFRSDFIANVSHEIKTPLTCIVGAVEALEDDPPPPQRTRLFDMLKKHSARLNSLVLDILNLASIEKQQNAGDRGFAEISLDSVVMNAVNLCSRQAENAGLGLKVTENAKLNVNGDSSLLEQALINLIGNAVKYSGGKKIEVSLKSSGGDALLSVRDDGAGIAQKHAKRIFERFYRVDKSRSRELGGTGLGLAIVKHTAMLHGGSVSLESTEGEGACFSIRIPLAEKPVQPTQAKNGAGAA